jgi:hypothetical protein
MKIIKYLSLILVVCLAVSCEKHEIEYKTTSITDMAEFQLHYFVPVTAVAANNINKVLINDSLYSNIKAPLATYNAIPNGGVGRFYTAAPGVINVKFYQGSAGDVLVYNQNVTVTKGKQNIFIHDFNLPPIVYDNGFPYTKNLTQNTDSVCYLKFYNFLYETTGVPTTLKLQYQYIDPHNSTVLINVGNPVAFGETTGWQQVKVIKDIFNSAGSRRVDFRIKVVDASGNITGDLQIRNTSGVYVNYADFWTEAIGRRYHHVVSGFRAATPGAAVRTFTAL